MNGNSQFPLVFPGSKFSPVFPSPAGAGIHKKIGIMAKSAQICYDNCIIHIGRFSGKECALWRESAKIEMAEY